MPKPKLPDEERKEMMLRVRILRKEVMIIANQAKKGNCKSISQYIRKLIAEDVKKDRFADCGIPQLQRRK